ncbi:MAG TPA: helix-turn-helix transcriptional regulator [Acidimicrobiales bacterium]|nr:helix-turn-helix transcriptional regulator [Acidimicrobiales bacterium]
MLRKRRRGLDLTQAQLAARLGLAQTVISQIEAAQRRLDILELAQLCDALDLDFLHTIDVFRTAYDDESKGAPR